MALRRIASSGQKLRFSSSLLLMSRMDVIKWNVDKASPGSLELFRGIYTPSNLRLHVLEGVLILITTVFMLADRIPYWKFVRVRWKIYIFTA